MRPRIRSVKPDLFQHEDLFELEKEHELPIRLAFIGLFTMTDKEGRFQWRPRALQNQILPYDSQISFGRILDALESKGFVEKYAVGGEIFGCIPKWKLHQIINNREAASTLPASPSQKLSTNLDACNYKVASQEPQSGVTETHKGIGLDLNRIDLNGLRVTRQNGDLRSQVLKTETGAAGEGGVRVDKSDPSDDLLLKSMQAELEVVRNRVGEAS